MKAIIRGVTLVGVAAAFVALTVVHLAADVCVYKPPKVRRICGVIVGPDGAAVPGVEVTIFKDATTVVVSKTADAGELISTLWNRANTILMSWLRDSSPL